MFKGLGLPSPLNRFVKPLTTLGPDIRFQPEGAFLGRRTPSRG